MNYFGLSVTPKDLQDPSCNQNTTGGDLPTLSGPDTPPNLLGGSQIWAQLSLSNYSATYPIYDYRSLCAQDCSAFIPRRFASPQSVFLLARLSSQMLDTLP